MQLLLRFHLYFVPVFLIGLVDGMVKNSKSENEVSLRTTVELIFSIRMS